MHVLGTRTIPTTVNELESGIVRIRADAECVEETIVLYGVFLVIATFALSALSISKWLAGALSPIPVGMSWFPHMVYYFTLESIITLIIYLPEADWYGSNATAELAEWDNALSQARARENIRILTPTLTPEQLNLFIQESRNEPPSSGRGRRRTPIVAPVPIIEEPPKPKRKKSIPDIKKDIDKLSEKSREKLMNELLTEYRKQTADKNFTGDNNRFANIDYVSNEEVEPECGDEDVG